MSVGPYKFVKGLPVSHSITLTHDGEKITGGIALSDTITAYVRCGGERVSEIDTVDLTRAGSDLPNSVMIVSFTATDNATWPEEGCELVIIRNDVAYHDDRWEVIAL